MPGRVRVPLFVVALVLLGLLGLLATLQFQWLGQVSDAERDRMRATLEAGASSFAQDFDGELTRAYLMFQSDPLGDADDPQARFAARYDRWHASSKYPRLIRNFYVFAPGEIPRLEKFDPAARTFTAIEWPDSMRDWRAHLVEVTTESNSVRGGDTLFIRRLVSPIWESVPALVVPSPLLVAGEGRREAGAHFSPRLIYTILEIDQEYVAGEMLPALAEQHLVRIGGAEFQFAIVSRPPGSRVIYRSSESFSPAPDVHADARTDLFAVRPQDFGRVAAEVHRLTAFATTLRSRAEKDGQPRQSGPGTGRQLSVVVQGGSVPAEPGSAQGETQTSSTVTKVATTPAIWQLILTHQSGSLEAAVGGARRRNLLVSSSILVVLGASMGLLILATRRAQRLAQQQMEFVATVSHELRTPLAVIRSAAENLADGIVDDQTQVRKYGELVRGEGRRLTEMVEQILEFSGIQSGERKLNPTAVAVGPLVRDVVDASASLAAAAGVEVKLELPDDLPPVLGDEPALGRVFQNLFVNAVKYGAGGGWIGIDARRHGNDVLVTIADRGIGIDPSDQDRIFDPFYRAPAVVQAQIQGAGLGLSLVRRIVQAHGGSIAVRSAPGAGAAFTVRLPVATSEPARRTAGLSRRSATPSAGSGAEAPRYS
jgi:signal transduction histidine kinase